MQTHNQQAINNGSDTKKDDIGVLSDNEKELIRLLRYRYRFGKVTVIMHEGIPKRIEETVKYESLDVKA